MCIFLNCMFKIISENKDRITLDTQDIVLHVFHHFYHTTVYTLLEKHYQAVGLLVSILYLLLLSLKFYLSCQKHNKYALK